MGSFKLASVSAGLLLLLFGGLFYAFILFLLLNPENRTNLPLLGWMSIGIFSGLWLHGGVYIVRQNFRMSEDNIAPLDTENKISAAGAMLGKFASYYSIIKTAVSIFFLVCFILPFAYILFRGQSIILTPAAISYAGGLILYVVLLQWLVARLASAYVSFGRKQLPSFTIEGANIVIDLNIRQLFSPNKKFVVTISFDEIRELRTLSFFEAETLAKFRLAPDLPLLAASLKDETKYLAGKISRPNYYAINPAGVGQSLLIRGENLFYLIAVSNTNCDELIAKFRDYKSRSTSSQ